MPARLEIILPEETFQEACIYGPITDAVENCIDIYMELGVSDEELPRLLASLYHLEYYCGRVNGSGNKYYLCENAENFDVNLSYARTGAEAIGWKYGVDLIESVRDWCLQNTNALSTLTSTDEHSQAMKAFDSGLFQNDLSRKEAKLLLAVLPQNIENYLLQQFDDDRFGSRSEYYIRTFMYLWSSKSVKFAPKYSVPIEVAAAVEASFPGLAEKTRAEREAKYKASLNTFE